MRDFIIENRFGITKYQQRILQADIKSLTEREKADRRYLRHLVGARVRDFENSLKGIEGREDYLAKYAKRVKLFECLAK